MRFLRRAVWFALFLTCGRPAMAGDIAIYGLGPGSTPVELYQISAANGAATAVGPTLGFFVDADALAVGPDGVLSGAGQDTLFTQQYLLTINSGTGAASLAQQLTGIPADLNANSYAFASDGTLFAIYGNQDLYSIDTSTGAATLVNSLPASATSQGLAMSPGGTLYLANGLDLYTVDQSTGAESLVAPLSFDAGFGENGAPQTMDLSFDPATGVLYTSVYWPGDPQGETWLGTINTATGEVSSIGQTALGLDGIAVEALPEPRPVFLIFAGFLVFLRLRKRYAV